MRQIFVSILFWCCMPLLLHARQHSSALRYTELFPKGECSESACRLAFRGYDVLFRKGLIANSRYLTIIDYTKRSSEQRLFIIDMKKGYVVLSSVAAHGFGSDPDSTTIPYRFSNRDGSRATSIGFYLTGNVYFNHRPGDSLGLCLFGLDSGYNDAAAAREIVMHYGATEYAGKVYVTDTGAGRSYGCPALPLSTNSKAINLIKGGSVLFIYSDKLPGYAAKSSVLTGRLRLLVMQQGPPPNNCSCNLQGKEH